MKNHRPEMLKTFEEQNSNGKLKVNLYSFAKGFNAGIEYNRSKNVFRRLFKRIANKIKHL
jgi:hypothetical protein